MEPKIFIIKSEEVFAFGRNEFLKDIEDFLTEFRQEEQIEILETIIRIVKNFIDKKEYEEGYLIYKNDFLKQYLWRTANADRKNILDYFTFSGLQWRYSHKISEGHKSSSFEMEESDEVEMNKAFESLLKMFLRQLQTNLHILLVYKSDDRQTDFEDKRQGLTSPFEIRPIQTVLALYIYYLQESKYLEYFENGTESKGKAIEKISIKYGVSAKNFETNYNRISKSKHERLNNQKYLEQVIKDLEGFPIAKSLAQKELNESINNKALI